MWRVNNGILEKDGNPLIRLDPINRVAGEMDLRDLSEWLEQATDAEEDGYAYSEEEVDAFKEQAHNDAIELINAIIDAEFDKADLPKAGMEKLLLALDEKISELER